MAITLTEGSSNADFSNAYFEVGNGYVRKKDSAHAIANYTEAIRLNPKNENALYIRGNLYLVQKDYVRAIADFDQAITINPQIGNGDAYASRGKAYFMQNDFAHAIADYDQAIRINPQNADTISNRRIALDKQKAAASVPSPSAGVQSVAGYQPGWIGRTMVVRGTISRFVQRKVNGEPYVFLYFKERPDSTVVACSRDDNWLLGVLQAGDFQSVVGKTLEYNGEVVKGTCTEQGAGLWIWQRSNARLVSGPTR